MQRHVKCMHTSVSALFDKLHAVFMSEQDPMYQGTVTSCAMAPNLHAAYCQRWLACYFMSPAYGTAIWGTGND